jgi:hypothetical protein
MFDSLSFKENFVNHLESNTAYQYGELNQQTLMEVIISHVSRIQIACRRLSNARNELSRCKRIKERLKNASGSCSAVCGTDLGMESSADCRELETVCFAIVGDAIGGPSLSTVVVVC